MKRTILALLAVTILVAIGALFVILRPAAEKQTVAAAQPPGATTAPVEDSDRPSPSLGSARDEVAAGRAAPAPDPSVVEATGTEPRNAGRIRGRLVDAARVPIAGLIVMARERWLAQPIASGSDGRFEVVAILPARSPSAELELVARGPGHAATTILGKVSAGGTTDLGDIVVAGAAIAAGRVTDESGRGLGDIEVRCTPEKIAPHEPQFRAPRSWTSETRTDPSGAFRLSDVPPDSVRIWAGADDRFWAATPALELAPGTERTDIELVVPSIPRDDMVAIVVLDPDDAPVAGASVTCQSSGVTSGTTDDRGRFVHYTMNQTRVPVTIVVSDPYERWPPVVAEDVQPGTLDLVLHLGRPTTMRLHVVDEGGLPVESFGARSLVASDWLEDEFPRTAQDRHAGGAADLVVPTLTFSIEIDAPRFALEQVGPFDPASAPASLEIRLRSLPGLRGVVRTAQGPLAGASVSSHVAVASDDEYLFMGLPARYLRRPAAQATTDARGEFVLTARDAGTYWVRVTADGYAPADRGPLDVDPATGTSGLVVELSRGGSIAGRIIGYPDESTADMFVAASRGDTYAFTVRTDATGAFRMDGLTPGAWWVAKHPSAIDPRSVFSSRGKKTSPAVFTPNCEVFDGQTTPMDIALHPVGEARLHGRLAIGGAAASECKARLSWRGAGSSPAQVMTLDADGQFVLAAVRAGAWELSLETGEQGANMSCTARLELTAGDNEWSRDIEVGSVEGQVPARFAQERVRVRWSSAVGDALHCQGSTVADNAGHFAFRVVAAGSVRVVADAPDGSHPARDIELAPGGTLRVDM